MKLSVLVGFGPGHIVLDGDQLPKERGTAAHTFEIYLRPYNPQPMSIVAKRSPISATAEHFFNVATVSMFPSLKNDAKITEYFSATVLND